MMTTANGALVALAAAANRGPLDVLSALALILCVAAITTVVFQWIRQPVVLGYLLAGLIVGPHVFIPLFADVEITHLFADLGVILLMFCLGLEFSLRRLVRVAPTAGIVVVIECSLMIWLGYTAASLFGWSVRERLFTGAMIAISSTTIIVKAFAEKNIKGKLADTVFGILVVEDLVAILLLALLTTIASGAGLSASGLGVTVGRLGGFLVGMLVVGLLVVPRLVRLIVRLGRKETIVVACVGISFASALLARHFGYSVALGAFLGGLLVAESGEARTIEHLIEPVRDVFAAVFFVSVGMLIDPHLVLVHWKAVAVLTLAVLLGKVGGVTLGAFIAGNGVRTSIQAAMSVAQIGEFSFITVGVGLAVGAVHDFLYPIAVAISALTTLTTPLMIRLSGPLANTVDRRLPHAVQTFASLYGTWIQQIRTSPDRQSAGAGDGRRKTAGSRIRRLVWLLLADVGVIAAILIGAAVEGPGVTVRLGVALGVGASLARLLVAVGAIAIAGPFVVGAVRVTRALGLALAVRALPSGGAGLDLAAAPRRALLVTIQLGILLVAGLPLVVVTQPFWPGFPGVVALAVVVLGFALPFWRGATNLHGHVRAGAQVILEAVARQGHADRAADRAAHRPDHGPANPSPGASADDVKQLVPGIGDARVVALGAGSAGVGRTLKELNLRGRTGASAVAIERTPGGTMFPAADEILRDGDRLVLVGTQEAVDAADAILTGAVAASGAPSYQASYED